MVKKLLLLTVALALLGMLSWKIYGKVKHSGEARQRARSTAVAVEVAPVERGTIHDLGLFTGTLVARAQFVVAPKIPGRLERLLVDIGDAVKQGQLVALLDAEEIAEQVRQAKAELDVARASVEESRSALERGRNDYDRAKALFAKEIASQAELDAAKAFFDGQTARHNVALAQVAHKEAALKSAEVRLSYTQIRATWEGGAGTRLVGERFADAGTMLRANDPIVSIVDIASLTAVVHVVERDYTKVQPGLTVTVTADAFPRRSFTGRVARVAPVLREGSRQARVEIEVRNDDTLLKPGMFVRAEVDFARHDNATLAPVTALIKRQGRQGVYVADLREKKANFVPVTVGIVQEGKAEILEPQLAGLVVTMGQHLLTAGAEIVVPETPAAKPPSPEAKPGGAPRK
jgi:RND family efflux transporter MFP subunit